MSTNRFERVDTVQDDAITLSLRLSSGSEIGVVTLPANAAGGTLSEDKISGELAVVDAFRSAVKLANDFKLAIVVMDPERLWNKEWGELYTPIDD